MRFSTLLGFFFAFRVAVPHIFFNSNPQSGLVAVGLIALGLAGVALSGKKHSPPVTPTLRYICIYLLWAGLTICWTPAPLATTLGHWGVLVVDVLLIWLALGGPSSEEFAQNLALGWIVGAVTLAAIVPFLPVAEDDRIENEAPLNPHNLGPILAIGTMFALFRWRASGQRRFIVVACLLVLGIVVSGNKTDLVCVVAAASVLTVVWHGTSMKQRLKVAVLGLGIVALGIVFLGSYVVTYASDPYNILTLTGRVDIWAEAMQHILEHPIIGNGFYGSRELLLLDAGFDAGQAHNEWLQAWLTLGLPGLLLLVLIYRSILRAARRADSVDAKMLLFAFLVYGLLHSVTEAPFELSIPLVLMITLTSSIKMRALS